MKLLQEMLAEKYHYKMLPEKMSNIVQTIYAHQIPAWLEDNTQLLYTCKSTLICKGYDRIVIGDYGAYIEFNDEQANKDVYIIAPGQEYRLDPRYNHIKYIWLTACDNSNVKIYYQKAPVNYADYLPNKYYVSIFECYPAVINNLAYLESSYNIKRDE